MLTRAFSDILVFSYNHFSRHTNISFIYTHHLHIIIALSFELLFVSSCFGWYMVWFGFFFSRHAPPVVENAQSVFLFPSGFVVQDANRPAGCAFAVARSREMMLVPVCCAQFLSLFFFLGFSLLLSLDLFWMFNFFSCYFLFFFFQCPSVIILTSPLIASGQTSQKQDLKV